MAAPLLRALPLHRLRLAQRSCLLSLINGPTIRRPLCTSAAESSADGDDGKSPSLAQIFKPTGVKDAPHYPKWMDFRSWKEEEAEIFEDIEPITCLVKEILHSDRYMDGQRLTPKDKEAVVDKLLAYHPRCEDKIGVGIDSIMVDRHPEFTNSRCLFVVRTDGGWIDFSYQKCLRAYIRDKYPFHADKFIKEYFKRGST